MSRTPPNQQSSQQVNADYEILDRIPRPKTRLEVENPLLKKQIDNIEKELGKLHPKLAKQLNNLAWQCENLGKQEEVKEDHRRTLEMCNKRLGADEPNVSKTMNNPVSHDLKQCKVDEVNHKQIFNREYERKLRTTDAKRAKSHFKAT